MKRPRRVLVNFKGIVYEMDRVTCQHALVRRQVEGEFHSMELLAAAAGVSRSTASRFFAGRQMSLTVALAVLCKLKLSFDDVFRPCDIERDEDRD
jgi:DNA-binding XRE family transcriptional regulator